MRFNKKNDNFYFLYNTSLADKITKFITTEITEVYEKDAFDCNVGTDATLERTKSRSLRKNSYIMA